MHNRRFKDSNKYIITACVDIVLVSLVLFCFVLFLVLFTKVNFLFSFEHD